MDHLVRVLFVAGFEPALACLSRVAIAGMGCCAVALAGAAASPAAAALSRRVGIVGRRGRLVRRDDAHACLSTKAFLK